MFNLHTDQLSARPTLFCQTHNRYIPLDPANRHYQEVLDAIIAEGAACFEGDIPEELQAAADEKKFNQQLVAYTSAVERLAHYVLADGREQVTEMQDSLTQLTDSDGQLQFDSDYNPIYEQIEVITVKAIEPLPATVTETQFDSDGEATVVEVPNSLITKDNEERAAAQAVVDATPQAVIDAYNS